MFFRAVIAYPVVLLHVHQRQYVRNPIWILPQLSGVTGQVTNHVGDRPPSIAPDMHALAAGSHIHEKGLVVEDVDHQLVVKEDPGLWKVAIHLRELVGLYCWQVFNTL